MNIPQKNVEVILPERIPTHPAPVKKSVYNPDLSVIIPVYNEADAITPLLEEIVTVLENRAHYEIIVVDDGSTDATSNVLTKTINETAMPLRFIRHVKNYGQSAAIHTGIESARASWIITMDGDGQNNPADILKLIAERDNANSPALKLICGHRKRRNDNFVKRASSRIANIVRALVLRDMTPDTGCGLKLIHRSTFLNLPFFDHMHRFIPALMRFYGADIRTVEISHRPRKTGKSKYSIHNRLWVGIIDLFGMLWLAKRAIQPAKEEITRHDF